MKKTLTSFLLVTLAAATAADPAPLTGKWQVHTRIADHETDWNCAFVQDGGDLTGTCASDAASGKITGKIDDKKVIWTHKFISESNGPITLTFRGAINSATSVTGFVTVQEYGVDGDFTATLSN